MKIGDRVKIVSSLYNGIVGNSIGTITSEYISNSQYHMFHPGETTWNVKFDDPELNHYFKESEMELMPYKKKEEKE